MTTCDEIRVFLALRTQDRTPGEEQRVRSHVGRCTACAARAEAYATQDRVIGAGPRIGLTPAQRSQLLSTIERKHAQHEARGRVTRVVSAVAAVVAVIGMALGLRYLHESEFQIIPGPSLHPVTPTTEIHPGDGRARISGVDFAVVDHELTPCATAESGEERCAPGGQIYLWVRIRAETVEAPDATPDSPEFSVVHQAQEQSPVPWLPAGRQSQGACAPENRWFIEEECHFWIGVLVPEGARVAELQIRTEGERTVFVWSLEDPEVAHASQPASLVWPTTRREISGWSFHDPRNPDHPGIDIAADEGDPIFAVADGLVIFAGLAGDYGNLVVVEHADGWSSYYGQLSEALVLDEQELEQGELLGRAGSTGHSSGPHLHFELRHEGVPVDPMVYLPRQTPLTDLLIRPDELPGTVLESGGPDDWVARPMAREGEADAADWIGPLAKADGYIEALQVQGRREIKTADGASQVVYVANAAFRFDTPREAQRAYEGVVHRGVWHARERLYAGVPSPGTEAQTFVLTDPSEDVVYWLVAVSEHDVLLLTVNGPDKASAKGVFDAAASSLLAVEGLDDSQNPEASLAALFVQDAAGACGWEVLGEGDDETYVWAICQSPRGTAVSAPAVFSWTTGETGTQRLLGIQMPRDGSYYGDDVRQLFPPEVQARIFERDVDVDAIWGQIERELATVVGTVAENATGVRVLTLEDAKGVQWHVPWSASRGVRWPDGSVGRFEDIRVGMRVEVVGFPTAETGLPKRLAAVRLAILDTAASP